MFDTIIVIDCLRLWFFMVSSRFWKKPTKLLHELNLKIIIYKMYLKLVQCILWYQVYWNMRISWICYHCLLHKYTYTEHESKNYMYRCIFMWVPFMATLSYYILSSKINFNINNDVIKVYLFDRKKIQCRMWPFYIYKYNIWIEHVFPIELIIILKVQLI